MFFKNRCTLQDGKITTKTISILGTFWWKNYKKNKNKFRMKNTKTGVYFENIFTSYKTF
jgi:hypothetical protein